MTFAQTLALGLAATRGNILNRTHSQDAKANFCSEMLASTRLNVTIWPLDFSGGATRDKLHGTNGFLRKICGCLRKSAVSCRNLRLRNAVLPRKTKNLPNQRKSAKKKTANLAPFVPFSLSLLFPLEIGLKDDKCCRSIPFAFVAFQTQTQNCSVLATQFSESHPCPRW